GPVWSGVIKVEDAHELRLHLENVILPPGTIMWVYGSAGAETPFDSALIDDRMSLWTPSVDGDTIHLEVEIPRGSSPASFVIREIAQIESDALAPHDEDVSCLV